MVDFAQSRLLYVVRVYGMIRVVASLEKAGELRS